jgi:hypothetical protein
VLTVFPLQPNLFNNLILTKMRTTLLTLIIVALAACDPNATSVTPEPNEVTRPLTPDENDSDRDDVQLRGASQMRVSRIGSNRVADDTDADEGCARYLYSGYYIAGDTVIVDTRGGGTEEKVSSIFISGETLKAKKVRQVDENRFSFVLLASPNFTAGSKILKFATNRGIFSTRLNVVNRLQNELYGTADYEWRSVGVSHDRYFGAIKPFDGSNLVRRLIVMENGERRLVDSEDAEYYTTILYGRSCESPHVQHSGRLRRLAGNVAEHCVGYVE